MKIISREVGSLGTNCYIVFDEETREAAVIDPGGSVGELLGVVGAEKLTVKYIINTHGHADHVMANLRVKDATGAPILIHAADAGMLTSGQLNLSAWIGGSVSCGPADTLLNDGDVIEISPNLALTVIHTPGHTPGGICLKTDGVLFSGDTLFAESIGRTDFPGGSYSQLITNIKEKLLVLDDASRSIPATVRQRASAGKRK
jgi:glyoxylase-like metal-dependent hydrolase (beta-lactamase superfamily II)